MFPLSLHLAHEDVLQAVLVDVEADLAEAEMRSEA